MGDGTYKILGSVFVFKNEAQIIFLNLFSFFFFIFFTVEKPTRQYTQRHIKHIKQNQKNICT